VERRKRTERTMESNGHMKKKPHLQLVTTKDTVAKYDIFYIYMCDEGVFEYKLSEYTIYRGEEWVEVVKKDGTTKEAFSINNISRVAFVSNKVKVVEPTTLKPVV
jgi:hypothetical protein